MHPHRAEAGTTLPTHAEHLLLNFAVEEVRTPTIDALVDLMAVATELLAVVDQTMQPATASLSPPGVFPALG
jgi:hypothetical protein